MTSAATTITYRVEGMARDLIAVVLDIDEADVGTIYVMERDWR